MRPARRRAVDDLDGGVRAVTWQTMPTVLALFTIDPIRRYLSHQAISDAVPRQESAATDTPVSTGEGETSGEHCPAHECPSN